MEQDPSLVPIELIREIERYHNACRDHYYRRGSFSPNGDVLAAEMVLKKAIAKALVGMVSQ